jgi:tRNA-specific 2-thiouridylase
MIDNPPPVTATPTPTARLLAGPLTCVAAMSGGVDSSVAALLAVRESAFAGRLAGLTMRLWSPGDAPLSEKIRQCCGPTAFEDAKDAARAAGIPHYLINFEAAFQHAVVDYFCREYVAGRTPNPCVACNNLVKFGVLLDFVEALGAAAIVTGHYAEVTTDDEGVHLARAADPSKDQSYMLAGLRPSQLARLRLPLGSMTKDQVRTKAREFGLATADKPDSVDLCFVDGDYRTFVAQRMPEGLAPGPIMTLDGRFVGRHDGVLNYTVGQRRGLPNTLSDGPWYVVRIEPETATVVIGRRDALARHEVRCSRANILRPRAFADGAARGMAVCRYRSGAVPAVARWSGGDALLVTFHTPVPVAAPGQLLVLYDGAHREVVASGIIEP